jgi:hypothetical protein
MGTFDGQDKQLILKICQWKRGGVQKKTRQTTGLKM